MKELSVTPDLVTGMKLIDDQHREFFRRANAFMAAASDSSDVKRDKAVELYAFLHAYIVEHFSTEQKLMEQHRYPQMSAHLEAHAFFIAELKKLEGHANGWSGAGASFMRVNYLLTDWFVNHIKRTDRLLVRYLIQSPQVGATGEPPAPA